ncbi:putative DNA repair protein MutK [Bradyrhizobium sp. AZCC 1678]
MSVGLIGLLDDIAGIAKVAAASLDDVASQAAKRVQRRQVSSSTIPPSRPVT